MKTTKSRQADPSAMRRGNALQSIRLALAALFLGVGALSAQSLTPRVYEFVPFTGTSPYSISVLGGTLITDGTLGDELTAANILSLSITISNGTQQKVLNQFVSDGFLGANEYEFYIPVPVDGGFVQNFNLLNVFSGGATDDQVAWSLASASDWPWSMPAMSESYVAYESAFGYVDPAPPTDAPLVVARVLAVPEPSSALLAGIGCALLLRRRRR